MNAMAQPFFDRHPDPMLVYDPSSLQILDVNAAAVSFYGWSRSEFMSKTLFDLHMPEDAPRVRARVMAATEQGVQGSGIWRQRRRDGSEIHVDIIGYPTEWNGRVARLTSARDVTRIVALERERTELLARERAAREENEVLARRFRAMFETLPDPLLVLSPDGYTVMGASDAYLKAAGLHRHDVIGRPVLDLLPEALPGVPGAIVAEGLKASLDRVVESGKDHVIHDRPYPPFKAARAGTKPAARVSLWNRPVLDENGRILWIFHQIWDAAETAEPAAVDPRVEVLIPDRDAVPGARAGRPPLDDDTAEMRTVQRLLRIAVWHYCPATGIFAVSTPFHDIFGTDPAQVGPTVDGYLALVHPEDCAIVMENFLALAEGRDTRRDIRHRAIRPSDGKILHLIAAGQVSGNGDGVIVGMLQDITIAAEAELALKHATDLLTIAGQAAQLGGWRVEGSPRQLTWTEGAFKIFDLPQGRTPVFEDSLALFAPGSRPLIRSAMESCLQRGEPIDAVLQVTTGTGSRIWVQVVGQALRDQTGQILGAEGSYQDVTELIAMRERAAHLSASLARTLENISEAFFTLDEECRFTFLNTRAETLLRNARADLIGRHIWDIFPEARDSSIGRCFADVANTGISARFVEYYAPFDAWYEISAHHTPDGLAVYFRDVTEDRQREELLRLLEAAVSRINDMVFITEAQPWGADDAAPFVLVNEAVLRRTRYARDELIGKSPQILHGPGTAPEDVARLRDAMIRGEAIRSEILYYNKRGRPFWTELDIVPLADDSGQTRFWVGIGRDITGRRRSEETLRISEERFRLVSRATSDVIWDWDLETNTLWWNEALETLLGMDPGLADGDTSDWSSWIHADERHRVSDSLRAAMDGGAKSWQEEHRITRGDGATRRVVNRAVILRDAAGDPIRVLGAITDTTEQHELEERLRQSQKLEAVGQLTGGIAHDFNNLLTVILGNAVTMIETLPKDNPMHGMAQMTANAAQRGAELTSRLLAFARKQTLEPKVVRLDRVVTGMEALIRRALSQDIEISVRGEPSCWHAEVDPGQLEVALLNLVINARDAMPGGGTLVVETVNLQVTEGDGRDVPPGDYAMVSVTDTGTGMTPEVLARVFDPFFTTKEVGKGSGLGLSMVYGFVNQSHGHARILSAPGEGTSVRLFFPRSSAPETAGPVPETQPAPRSKAGGEHLLLVEDHPMVREHVVGLLESLGYRVTPTASGLEALAVLREPGDIDLLFTDIVMPGGMNGIELADQASKLRPGLRVLLTSGYTESMIPPGSPQQQYPLLSKPYRRNELSAKIRAVLDDVP